MDRHQLPSLPGVGKTASKEHEVEVLHAEDVTGPPSDVSSEQLVKFQDAVADAIGILAGVHLEGFHLSWKTGDGVFLITVSLENIKSGG